jgi:hypothetical protein
MEETGSARRRWWGAALLATAAAIVGHQLFFRPIVGLADNGDYARVTDHIRLASELPAPETAGPGDRYFLYVVSQFRNAPPGNRRNLSSEILLGAVARLAALPFSRGGRFDLRWMGAVHALALLGAAVFFWRKASRSVPAGAAVAAGAFAVFAFTDVGYAAPLNSFYTQEASLVFLFWTAAFVAASLDDGGRSALPIAGYFVAAVLFVASKPQEAAQSIPLALFGAYLARRPNRRGIAAGGAALLFLAAGAFYFGTGREGGFRQVMLYKTVFYEILPRSPDPAGDLRVLGLDPGLERYSGTTTMGPDSPFRDPRVRAAVFPRLDYGALVRLYIRRPARAASELVRAAPAGLDLRADPGFGNFEKSAGFPPGARSSAYSAWTRLRLRAGRSAPLALVLFFAAHALLAITGRISPGARASLLMLVAMGTLSFLICTLSSAHIEIGRKLYIFHAITDLMIVVDLALAGRALAARWSGAGPTSPPPAPAVPSAS